MNDPHRVARYGEDDVARLLANPGITRSRAKIAATIHGAKLYCETERSSERFSDLCWQFTDGKALPSTSAHWSRRRRSERISRAMKARGFKFAGPTIVYAWMQAVGILNDHAPGCFRRDQV